MTRRPDDPYIARINKRSYDKQQIIDQLTHGVPTWRDTNQNNQTEISYTFNNGGFNIACIWDGDGNDAGNRLTGGPGAEQKRGGGGADTFVYNDARDSTPKHPDTILDFTSGTDKIDVSGALQKARVSGLNFVQAFSGKEGETLLTYDPATGKGSVSIDLNGNGRADLLIKTHGQVKPEDIVQSDVRSRNRWNNRRG